MGKERAIIDIGSNTVRLVIYNGPPRAPIVLHNEKVTAKLGKDVVKTGLLSEKSMQVALQALKRYAALLRLMAITDVQAVATAAVRDARNGGEFLRAIGETGLSPRLLSGEEEARTSALGVIAAFPDAKGVAGDLGGGSLELVRIAGNECEGGITLPFGTLALPDLRENGHARFVRRVAKGLRDEGWQHGRGQPFYIVGGSWRALAVYAMHQLEWPLEDPHDFELSPKVASRICAALAAGEIDPVVPRISPARMASLPDAAALLGALVAEIEPSRIVFSSWGLREGLLYQTLDADTRAQDPMIAGIAAFTHDQRTRVETAEKIAQWVGGIVPESTMGDGKLRLAATMLAHASMRSEPNMRAEQALDWALRKRWIGLDARGRALIAMAVLANSGHTDTPRELVSLAAEAELKGAAAWGLAIRLCRKLTNCADEAIAGSSLVRAKDKLVLSLEGSASCLYNGSVAKNFRALADWLEMDCAVEGAEAEDMAG